MPMTPFIVMAGLVPAIHVFASRAARSWAGGSGAWTVIARTVQRKTWMPGTRPGMTM